MIFAGRAGSTPAVTTLLTANNRNVFIMFPPDCVTDSSVMYTAMVGINVYSSSRNFKLFSVLAGLPDAPGGGEAWLISRALCETRPHPENRRAASLTTASKTKALRIIFAGKLGSTPAVITLLTPNNRNVFISLLIALTRANVAAVVGGVIAAAAGANPMRHFPGR
jgi:hypothetical protein